MNSITTKIRLPLIEDSNLLRDGIVSVMKPFYNIKIIPGSGECENLILEIHKLKTNVIFTGPGFKKFNVFSETVPITNK